MTLMKNPYGYWIFKRSKRSYARWKYEKYKGRLPKSLVIHHVNGNKDDNRLRNLKPVTQRHNNRLSKITKADIRRYQRWKRDRRR